MSSEKCNGWTNYETWATALHIDNDEGLYRYRCELVETAKNADQPGGSYMLPEEDFRRIKLADLTKDWVESLAEAFYFEPIDNPGLGGMFSDIGSLHRVDWDEIAANWLSE